jgi:hypothetical protein
MQEHVVHLLRIEGTADEECEEFLRCLYDRIEQASNRQQHVAPPGDV